MEVENGGKDVGDVVRVFEEDLVADGEVVDLVGGDVGEDVGLEPGEGSRDCGGGEGGEELVGDADSEADCWGGREGLEGGGVGVEETDG